MSDSTELYNYCTRCGEQLEDEIADVHANDEVSIPPLCRTCAVEVTTGTFRPIAELIVSMNTAFAEMMEPIVAMMEDMDVEESGDDDND